MNEEELFEEYILLELSRQLKEIVEDAEEILRKNVQSEVYNSYNPLKYNRTFDLYTSIEHVFSIDNGIVYFNANNIGHTNSNNEKVGMYTPKWIDKGHSDSTGIDNMYHNYNPPRNFIDKTIEELEQKYGKDCVVRIDN